MVEPTARSRLLAAVSAAQLATGAVGMVVALRRRHPYHVFWRRGRADAIARDTILKGTALSAPVSNLLAQAALTAVVARRPSRGTARALAGLGAIQVAGYLGERLVRRRLRPSGWDAVESPLILAGLGLAGAMAALGSRLRPRDGTVRSPSPARARGGRGRGGSVREGSLYGGLPYLAVGEGPPLVVFSGLSATHANPTGLGRWVELQTLKPMARHFTVYAVNRKPGLPAGSTIADLAGHYADAIVREFPGPVCVWGISTGGSIAQQFAIDHPQLVRRLVLAATACRLSPYGRQVQRRLAELIEDGRPRRAYAALGPALAATPAGGRCLAALMWLFGGSQRPDDPSDMLVTVAAEDVFDAAPRLHRIAAPTLLVAGGRDRFYSPALFRETAERIPGARLRLYQDKGHAGVMTHKPAIREIVAFLRDDHEPAWRPTSGRGDRHHGSAVTHDTAPRGPGGHCGRSVATTEGVAMDRRQQPAAAAEAHVPVSVGTLVRMRPAQRDEVFRSSPAGDVPTGVGDGVALLPLGPLPTRVAAAVIRALIWKGKVFDPRYDGLRNRMTPFGFRVIRAKVYKGPSRVDGEECIVLDYSRTSLVAHWIRDEIREVAGRTYLGQVFVRGRKLLHFTLTFPPLG